MNEMCKKGNFLKLENNLCKSLYGDPKPLIDRCLFGLVEDWNRRDIVTVSCCCGHGKSVPYMTVIISRDRLDEVLDDLESFGWGHLRAMEEQAYRYQGMMVDRNYSLAGKTYFAIYAFAGHEADNDNPYSTMKSTIRVR